MISKTEELNTKVPVVTIGIVIMSVIVGYYIGYMHSELKSQGVLLEVKHGFALEEVYGLRNDVNREVFLLKEKIKEMEAK